ncbi:MAG: DNA polymerase III subunit gamma/tau [Ignavibacteriaceae bacterium]|nr:DNA polymerase III subunit gamma/tau [Ignavibacteriaceae bacterium]
MSFIVTARKWRPQVFKDVVGQEHITSTLKNAIKNNRIAHSYIFTGPRGVGKTTTARILAKALNCLNPVDSEPCNKCELCLSIQNGQSMDIIEIDGASNRGIDEIRTLRESVKYSPSRGKYKIYIIDEVHMLTKESFNAFLKTLEEPPSHTVFIFATTDIQKVPLTIISRCQRFDFRRIQLNTIKTLLMEIARSEKIEIEDKTLTIIAKKADGALRDAESFFDQIVSYCGNKIDQETVSKMLNLIDDEIYFNISDAILKKDFNEVFRVSGVLFDNGYDFGDFINGLIEHFRNILTVILTKKTDLVECAEVYKTHFMEYVGKYSEGDLLRILNFLNKTQQEMRFTQNHRIKVEISLSHLIGFERSVTISDLLERISSSVINSTQGLSGEPEKKNSYPSRSTIPLVKSNIGNLDYQSEGEEQLKKEPLRVTLIGKNPVKDIRPKESIDTSDFSFESIVKKWDIFVNAVIMEKKFSLGPYVGNIELSSLEGNKLKVFLSDSDGKKSFGMDKDYLGKKTAEIFGKKIIFQFEERQGNNSFIKNEGVVINDPLIDLIISELGGEEISG